MSTHSSNKPLLPPLKCEQLEERQVLTVTVVTSAGLASEPIQSHPAATTATNFVLVHPAVMFIGSGTTQTGTPGSSPAAATCGSSGSTAGSSGTSPASAGTTGVPAGSTSGTASGGVAGGGPLFFSAGIPTIAASGNTTIPTVVTGYRPPVGAPASTPSNASPLEAGAGAVSIPSYTSSTPTSSLADTDAGLDLVGSSSSIFLAPTPATPGTAPPTAVVATVDDAVTSPPAVLLSSIHPTSTTSTTTMPPIGDTSTGSDDVTPIVVQGDSTQLPDGPSSDGIVTGASSN